MDAPLILIIDDNRLSTLQAKQMLKAAGFMVAVAETAQQGLESLGQMRPDLILMDILLPDSDGLELTRRLKSDPVTRDIPVVGYTADAAAADIARMRAAGCVGYLPKPLIGHNLRADLQAFLLNR